MSQPAENFLEEVRKDVVMELHTKVQAYELDGRPACAAVVRECIASIEAGTPQFFQYLQTAFNSPLGPPMSGHIAVVDGRSGPPGQEESEVVALWWSAGVHVRLVRRGPQRSHLYMSQAVAEALRLPPGAEHVELKSPALLREQLELIKLATGVM